MNTGHWTDGSEVAAAPERAEAWQPACGGPAVGARAKTSTASTTPRRWRFRGWLGVRVCRAAVLSGVALLIACTVEQIMIGVWYRIPTPPSGACPALMWQFSVDPQRSFSGYVSHDGDNPFADLSGTLNADDSFRLTVTDRASARTAAVTGQFTSQVSTLSIHGDGAGPGCDGRTFQLRLGRYLSRQGGGGGGGG